MDNRLILPSAAVLPIPVIVIVTPPGVSVGLPKTLALAIPVGVIAYTELSDGTPSAELLPIPDTERGYAESNVGTPSAAIEAMPVGETVTLPGLSVGTPDAAVLLMPVGVIVCGPLPPTAASANTE
jgi:hypothetical protein